MHDRQNRSLPALRAEAFLSDVDAGPPQKMRSDKAYRIRAAFKHV
jgi:hypothetical protein